MTAEQLEKALTQGSEPLLIDVRSRFEFRQGHLPGARNIPFWKLPQLRQLIARSAKSGTLLCCEHGLRAWLAGSLLRLSGVRRIDYLQGHMHSWKKADRRLVQG